METPPSQTETSTNSSNKPEGGEPEEAYVDVSKPEILESLNDDERQLIEDNWGLFQDLNQATDISNAFEQYRNLNDFHPEGERMKVYEIVKELKEKYNSNA